MDRGNFQEMSLMPGKDKNPARLRPNTFNVANETGFWKARFRPMFGKRVETGSTKAASMDGLAPLTA